MYSHNGLENVHNVTGMQSSYTHILEQFRYEQRAIEDDKVCLIVLIHQSQLRGEGGREGGGRTEEGRRKEE